MALNPLPPPFFSVDNYNRNRRLTEYIYIIFSDLSPLIYYHFWHKYIHPLPRYSSGTLFHIPEALIPIPEDLSISSHFHHHITYFIHFLPLPNPVNASHRMTIAVNINAAKATNKNKEKNRRTDSTAWMS